MEPYIGGGTLVACIECPGCGWRHSACEPDVSVQMLPTYSGVNGGDVCGARAGMSLEGCLTSACISIGCFESYRGWSIPRKVGVECGMAKDQNFPCETQPFASVRRGVSCGAPRFFACLRQRTCMTASRLPTTSSTSTVAAGKRRPVKRSPAHLAPKPMRRRGSYRQA